MAEPGFSSSFGRNPAENYERFAVPTIGAPAAIELVKAAALAAGERVLDVACGTGVVARLASQAVGNDGSVVGLDLNPGMLAVARTTVPAEAKIEWQQGDAQAMPFDDSSFDVALCQMSLQFIPDKRAALSEMLRVLAPGGRMALNAPGPTPRLFVIMQEAIAHHASPEAAGFVNHVFSLNDVAEVEELIKRAGFEDVSVRADTRSLALPAPREFLWQYMHGTPLAGVLPRMEDHKRAELEREFVDRSSALVRDGSLQLDVRMLTAFARKPVS